MSGMRIGVMGAGGRMGRALARAVLETKGCTLAGGTEAAGAATLGADLGTLAGLAPCGAIVTADAASVIAKADAILDFTVPKATAAFARLAAERGIVHVIGTTGLTASEDAVISEAAKKARIVKAGNMSLGVTLLAALTKTVAAALGPEFDIEIVEMHHRHKVDAPSGTALLLGNAAAAGREVALADHSVRTRDGHTGARKEGTIGFATLRGGDVVGDHTVIFAGPGERIELTHRASDRTIFARGAVKAAQWAVKKPPGLYAISDVLGL
jgi:4-hydroxy-tetrahydrodipicolinate reductase